MNFKIKKVFIAVLVTCFAFWPVYAMAEDNDGAANQVTQTLIGPQGPTGPQVPTGVQESIGPQGETGVNSIIQQDGTDNPTENLDLNNENTGSDSANENSVTGTNEAEVDLSSQTEISNSTVLDLNSGDNNIGANTSISSLTTGDIQGTISFINLGDSQLLGQDSTVVSQTIDGQAWNGEFFAGGNANAGLPQPSPISILENSATGTGSINLNNFDQRTIIAILDENNNNFSNNIEIDANTGRNDISENSVIGDITTGNINLAVNLINLADLFTVPTTVDLSIFNILNGFNNDIVISDLLNFLTGTGSENSNRLNSNNEISHSESNTITSSNNIEANTNTGGNNIGMNTVVGNVETGSTNTNAKFANLFSSGSPVFYIINVFGKWLGASFLPENSNVVVNQINEPEIIDMGNSETGADSTNLNEINSENILDQRVTNNVDFENNIKINANTGDNSIKNNTLVGDIKTGSINILSNVVNLVNNLGSAFSRVKIGIINIFGDWNGNLNGKSSVINDSSVEIKEEYNITASGIETDQASTDGGNGASVDLKIDSDISHRSNIDNKIKGETNYFENNKMNSEAVLANMDPSQSESSQVQNAVRADAQPQSGLSLPILFLLIPASIISLWLALEWLNYKKTK